MASQENFQLAAHRHFQDAEYLVAGNRLANAGQLFGLAAECGIKAVIVEGLRHQNPRAHLTEPGKKLPLIDPRNLQWLDDLSNIQGRISAGYQAIISSNISNFNDWSVDHRYWDEAALPNSLSNWQLAAKDVMSMLQQAQTDGIGSLRL